MNKPTTVRHALILTVAVTLVLLAGCKTAPVQVSPHAATTEKVVLGPIKMPAGVDLGRAKYIAENRRIKLYTELVGIGDASNEKLLFPPKIAQEIGITPSQMRRRFMDTVAASRRFELYDSTNTVTQEASDIYVDCQVVGTDQELQPIEGGVRVAVTRVMLSLQMKDRSVKGQDKLLFPAPVRVTGQTGRSTGDRTVIRPNENLQSPDVQRRLGQDYQRALQRAFDDASKRIDAILRPMGRVLAVDGNSVGIVGGSVHGLQGNDELVIFRATTAKLAGGEVFASTRPVAVVRCDGVGTESSQCTVFRRDPAFQPQVGDYAVLSDFSATGVRAE